MITKEQLDNWEGEVAYLRAQLAQAQERVREIEKDLTTTTQELEIWRSDYYKASNKADDLRFELSRKIREGLEELQIQLAQRDAEITRLVADQQWLDPGAVELIRAFGTFSIERLPDWNFAVAIKGDIYGIGMTVFDAISSAAAQIDKIKAAIAAAGEKGTTE